MVNELSEQGSNAIWGPSQQRGLAVLLIGVACFLAMQCVRDGWGDGRLTLESSRNRDFVFQLNINDASWVELVQLPEIGPGLAERIIAYREKNGPFRGLEDVGRVPGVGPATLTAIQPHLFWPAENP